MILTQAKEKHSGQKFPIFLLSFIQRYCSTLHSCIFLYVHIFTAVIPVSCILYFLAVPLTGEICLLILTTDEAFFSNSNCRNCIVKRNYSIMEHTSRRHQTITFVVESVEKKNLKNSQMRGLRSESLGIFCVCFSPLILSCVYACIISINLLVISLTHLSTFCRGAEQTRTFE